jgi:hypothetical protein
MASQSWGQVIAKLDGLGQSYASFTTAKSMLTSATATAASTGFITLPPNFFQIGSELDFDITANIGWASGQTWIFQIMLGAVIAATSGTLKTTTTGGTTEPWYIKAKSRCVSTGNGTLATLETSGFVIGRGVVPPGGTAGANYAAPSGVSIWSEAIGAAGTGFDSTVAQTLDFFAASGTSAAGNTIQLRSYRVVSWGNSAP